MPEQDAGTLTTLTLTFRERSVIAHALTVAAAMVDALGQEQDARDILAIWERVSPDYES
jgi:hypothetical protein